MISQSVAGQHMADILALDADGRLIIVEIKRDWSNRATVGQLLEYAAAMTGKNYEDLEELNRKYWARCNGESQYVPLLEQFRELTDDPKSDQKDIPKRQQGHRICIVAPGSDEGLLRIVRGGPHRLDHLAAFLRWTPQFLLLPVREILRGGEPEGKVPLRMFFQASVHLLRRRPSVRRVRSLAVV